MATRPWRLHNSPLLEKAYLPLYFGVPVDSMVHCSKLIRLQNLLFSLIFFHFWNIVHRSIAAGEKGRQGGAGGDGRLLCRVRLKEGLLDSCHRFFFGCPKRSCKVFTKALSAELESISNGEYPRLEARKKVIKRATPVMAKFGQALIAHWPCYVISHAFENGRKYGIGHW